MMTSPLSRLIYISSNQIQGDESAVDREIGNILLMAREANAAADITGALLFNYGCFAQVLEGPRGAVEATFERIQCDERHSDVVILSFNTVATRAFSSWSMGYVGDDPKAQSRFENIRIASGFDIEKIPSEEIFSILHQKMVETGSAEIASKQRAA